jgi:DNA (cytosine-5)-methyltransferase 1
MENVTNILSSTHKEDFGDWKKTLSRLGYYNKIYKLNAKNFGVPQKRERAYMISVLIKKSSNIKKEVEDYFKNNNLEDVKIAPKYQSREFKLKDVLRLDYSNPTYKFEADISQPNKTPSRDKIEAENDMLFDGKRINEIYVNTVTTKQDRNPNSGLIYYDSDRDGKEKWRYLTSRECFMLMGFDETDYSKAISYNPNMNSRYKLLTNDKMIKMAGNSICVDVLEALFKQIIEVNDIVFK